MADLKTLKKLQKSLTDALSIINEHITNTETPKEKEPKEKEKKPKKNLRMTKPIKAKLQKALEGSWEDSMEERFMTYVNDQPNDKYSLKTPEEHIADFASSFKTPLVGGGSQPLPDVLTYKQLKELKGLTETEPGVYRTKQGKFVTGPAEVPDEDMEDGTFEAADLLIGENTRRVYNSDEEFIGFWGIGKFKDADM